LPPAAEMAYPAPPRAITAAMVRIVFMTDSPLSPLWWQIDLSGVPRAIRVPELAGGCTAGRNRPPR
jgi:hypothetical protein